MYQCLAWHDDCQSKASPVNKVLPTTSGREVKACVSSKLKTYFVRWLVCLYIFESGSSCSR